MQSGFAMSLANLCMLALPWWIAFALISKRLQDCGISGSCAILPVGLGFYFKWASTIAALALLVCPGDKLPNEYGAPYDTLLPPGAAAPDAGLYMTADDVSSQG